MKLGTLITSLALVAIKAYGQDYQDYQDYADGYAEHDNLYENYAMHQQEKEVGGGGWVLGNRLDTCRISS